MFAPSVAGAATFQVTKAADTNDGTCDADCSLREAIGKANATAGADTVAIPAGTYSLTIPGGGEKNNATGDLNIKDAVTIDGAGAQSTTVKCSGCGDRVFDIASSPTFSITFQNLTVSSGSSPGGKPGGGIYIEGALDTTTLLDVAIVDNTSDTEGGGIAWSGSGTGSGSLTIRRSLIARNSAAGSDVKANSGGGIISWPNEAVSITNSTISGNTAAGQGGGLATAGPITLLNDTVVGNATTTINNKGAGWASTGGTGSTAQNTIISGNAGPVGDENCIPGFQASQGNNLEDKDTCSFSQASDQPNTDPQLAPLADNGGPTQTRELAPTSPARNGGANSGCPATDQRGVPRPMEGVCDIGAVEHYPHDPGQLPYFSFDSGQRLTDRADLQVNAVSGNLLVHGSDLQLAGTAGHSLGIDRYFNSQAAHVSGDLGSGWTMGSGADVSLRFLSDGTALFDGPTGYEVPFAPDGKGGYTAPTGIDATLCAVGGSCAGTAAAHCSSGNTTPVYGLTFHATSERYSFNSGGQLISDVEKNGNALSYCYDANALASVWDTKGHQTTVTTSGGHITNVTDPTGRSVQYAYDSGTGDLTTYTDANGKAMQYGYNGRHQIVSITDPLEHQTKVAYDSAAPDRVASVTRVTDPGSGTGPTWSFSYGGPTAPCDPAADAGKTVVTDPNNHDATYCYDDSDRVTEVQDANGNADKLAYNSDSNVVKLTRPNGEATTYTYDSTGENLIATQQPPAGAPTGANATAQYADAAHPYFPTQSTDALGVSSGYAYDGKGNLQTVTDGANDQITLAHNGDGTLASSTDQSQNKTAFDYVDGNLTVITPPSPLGKTTFTYDGLARVHTSVDGNGETTTYTYDNLDRPTGVAYADGTSIAFTYDADGNLTQRSDSGGGGTTTYEYDNLNRLTRVVYALIGGTTSYTYDGVGNMLSVTDAGGTVSYTYDSANRLISLVEPGGNCTSQTAVGCTKFIYDKDDNRVTTTYPNGVTVRNDYDAADRLTCTTATKAYDSAQACGSQPQPLERLSYSYINPASGKDANVFFGTTDLTGAGTAYTYDPLGRLAKADKGSGSDVYSYGYDKVGNITSRTHVTGGSSTTSSYGFNAANELCWSVSGSQASSACTPTPSGATTYTYDRNGNEVASSAGAVMAYNARNQMTTLTPPGGGLTHLVTYAGLNQSEMMSENGDTYTYSQMGVSSRKPLVGPAQFFTREPDGTLVDERTASSNHYYLLDGHSSVVGLADDSGALSDSYQYDPYGAPTSVSGTTDNPWRFASQDWITGSGLYKVGLRWQDPNLGRWTQLDPVPHVGDVAQGNRYTYVGDDPINHVDPTGASRWGACVAKCITWYSLYLTIGLASCNHCQRHHDTLSCGSCVDFLLNQGQSAYAFLRCLKRCNDGGGAPARTVRLTNRAWNCPAV